MLGVKREPLSSWEDVAFTTEVEVWNFSSPYMIYVPSCDKFFIPEVFFEKKPTQEEAQKRLEHIWHLMANPVFFHKYVERMKRWNGGSDGIEGR